MNPFASRGSRIIVEPQRRRPPGDGPVRRSETRNFSRWRRPSSLQSGWKVSLQPVNRTEKPLEVPSFKTPGTRGYFSLCVVRLHSDQLGEIFQGESARTLQFPCVMFRSLLLAVATCAVPDGKHGCYNSVSRAG